MPTFDGLQPWKSHFVPNLVRLGKLTPFDPINNAMTDTVRSRYFGQTIALVVGSSLTGGAPFLYLWHTVLAFLMKFSQLLFASVFVFFDFFVNFSCNCAVIIKAESSEVARPGALHPLEREQTRLFHAQIYRSVFLPIKFHA